MGAGDLWHMSMQARSAPMKSLKKFLPCPLETAVMTALLALLSITLFAAPGASGKPVQVSGWLLMEAGANKDVLVVVELDNAHCLPVKLKSNGRFSVDLPTGSQAVLRFSRAGHITKEVVLDTRNAAPHGTQQYKAAKVHFGVDLSTGEGHPQYGFDGPVGTLAFKRGTGSLAVKHHARGRSSKAPCAGDR